MPGTFSPPPRFSDPGMNHGTCVAHVPWCIPRSLTSGFLWNLWRGKSSRHSRRMRNPQFYVAGKRWNFKEKQTYTWKIHHKCNYSYGCYIVLSNCGAITWWRHQIETLNKKSGFDFNGFFSRQNGLDHRMSEHNIIWNINWIWCISRRVCVMYDSKGVLLISTLHSYIGFEASDRIFSYNSSKICCALSFN